MNKKTKLIKNWKKKKSNQIHNLNCLGSKFSPTK